MPLGTSATHRLVHRRGPLQNLPQNYNTKERPIPMDLPIMKTGNPPPRGKTNPRPFAINDKTREVSLENRADSRRYRTHRILT